MQVVRLLDLTVRFWTRRWRFLRGVETVQVGGWGLRARAGVLCERLLVVAARFGLARGFRRGSRGAGTGLSPTFVQYLSCCRSRSPRLAISAFALDVFRL